ncbi:thioredoxin family protein [Rhodobacteraceae bacterium RKSG542]|uniref:thioredoxin family protein n=1 Tax=Pseudovibrio flavus TaxID=2529854 RepID=UPI0012BD6FC2|nr:thioredoxin family protein [Pseudovibrio flavus]MTI17975.1 thioredoxin family protein [Pseudovibrio flavus]
MKQIKVYGPGCQRCETVAQMVKDAAAKLSIDAEVEKVSDPVQIAMAGVMSTPGISVDGVLVHAGGLPDVSKLEGWLAS